MYGRSLVMVLLISVLGITSSAVFAAPLPPMRPYAGIGLLVFYAVDSPRKQDMQLPLYEEPGLARIMLLNDSSLPGNEPVFGPQEGAPLIVSARKGEWLRVFFDDAGREAWINPQNKGSFLSWEQYLKLHTARMLPALQSQYYQLLQQPNGKQLALLTPRQVFKVLKLENSWGMVLTDKGQLGWLRWRDSDGRLTVGMGKN
ncbi:MAG TPA: hypothetical protein HPP97_12095 [Desulfuromonadales bacterium]|nr:hypothetical protein [Desulfuromonadales bacterium]